MGSTSTTTQNNKPYEAAEPLIQEGLADARQMYQSGGFNISPYGGKLVADYDPFRGMADAATPGAVGAALGSTQGASGVLSRAMSPEYYTEALQGVRDNVIADIMPSINSTFAGSGRTGGGLHQQSLAKGLSAGVADAYYDAFNQAENRALGAAQMVPGINNASFGALDYLQGAGQGRQAYQQDLIEADVFQDQQAKTAERNALQDYLALSTGAGSTFGVQSSKTQQNPGLMGILGLGMQAIPFF